MRLIISYAAFIISAFIGARSHKARIPRLSHMKGKADIVIRRIWHPGMKLKSWLTELFDPINCNCNSKINESIFPIQGSKNKNAYAQRENNQSKEMPPDELRCLPGFIPNGLNGIHILSPLHPFILPSLSSRKLIKNNIFFNRSQKLCP